MFETLAGVATVFGEATTLTLNAGQLIEQFVTTINPYIMPIAGLGIAFAGIGWVVRKLTRPRI